MAYLTQHKNEFRPNKVRFIIYEIKHQFNSNNVLFIIGLIEHKIGIIGKPL